MKNSVIVIGAGPGGLASAMLLASKGYEVKVLEKQPYIGGRNSEIKLGQYKFDMGPTFLNMPHIAEELFEAANRNLHDYVDMVQLETMYQLVFKDKTMLVSNDPIKMKEEIEKNFPGNSAGYDRFMTDMGKKLDALMPVLQSKMNRFTDLLQPQVLRALPQLNIGKSLFDVLSKYFTDDDLKISFTFQSKYLGMSPWDCPGAFSIISYMEHAYGVHHIMGGLNKLPHAMAEVVKEYGGEILTDTAVKKLWIEDKKVKGVYLEDGTRLEADDVIINSDFAHAMTNLVEEKKLKKYTPKKLAKKKYSCSTFMLYLGLDKQYDIPHHSIVFAEDYAKNVEEITKSKILSENPSIYVQNASKTDPTLAPAGKSALYILAPVPNNFGSIDWDADTKAFRKLVLSTLEQEIGLENIEPHIEVEKIITPKNWEEDLSVYKGATFNLGHNLSQMMVFRPHNKFEEFEQCWLVGGGTHPGSGLPTILESARITTNGILEKDGEKAFFIPRLPAIGTV